MESSMVRLVDRAVIQGSGPKICVVSTKAAMGQILVLLGWLGHWGDPRATRKGTAAARSLAR